MSSSASPARVLYADAVLEALERKKTLPVKFERMLSRLLPHERLKGKTVAIKMHLGGGVGFTTIHPVFVRILVEAVKAAGAKSVKVMDGSAEAGIARGYTREVLGAPVVSCCGESNKYVYPEKIGFKKLDEALFAGEAVDCDFFIDLSHIKGHGDCGFGGALKNIAMGVVPWQTRGKIHSLEGGISYDEAKCNFCQKCFQECRYSAIQADQEKKKIKIFFHHCTYCQHCVMICPQKALTMEDRRFEDFAEGMVKITTRFLQKFKPENLLFINFLMDITVYCDCWGFSSPALVPDLGILASDDIVAVETASLDMIKTENFLPGGLPKNRQLLEGTGHLFERIHGKDPYTMLRLLEKEYGGTAKYKIEEIR